MTVLASVLTILMSGVMAAYVTYRLNRAKEHDFFMRKKAEELYLAVEFFHKQVSAIFLPYGAVIKGQLSRRDFHEMQAKADPKIGQRHDEMTMLTRIYFPQIETALDGFMNARGGVVAVMTEHERAEKLGTAGTKEWFDKFWTATDELEKQAASFKDAIVREARRYGELESISRSDAWWRKALEEARRLCNQFLGR